MGGCLKTSLQRLEESNIWKCLRRILEMRGSDGLYVTTKGKRSVESWRLVRKASVREILVARLNCESRKVLP